MVNRGLVHVPRPPAVLHSCRADKAFCCILTSEERLVILMASPASSYNHTAFSSFLFVLFVGAAGQYFLKVVFIQQLSSLRSDLVQFEGRTPSERAAEGIGEARRWRGRAELCV